MITIQQQKEFEAPTEVVFDLTADHTQLSDYCAIATQSSQ
jgi:hypothetical protein